MTKKLLLIIGFLGIFSSQANAVYFPGGIDWANPSSDRFVLSLYLNMLGRAPQNNELRAASRFLERSDDSQTRLDIFTKMIETTEYQQIFGIQDNQWRVYRAPDQNYNNGNGFWRYMAANSRPSGFEGWRLSGESSESVAMSMSHYYDTYCYEGTPCIAEPARAHKRGADFTAVSQLPTHACADEANLVSQFEWAGLNGTTFPQGTDRTTLCMGNHYYEAKGVVLNRFQCDTGYVNCKRDETRDIRGQRVGRDANGKPTLFFADGSRLILTSYSPNANQGQQNNERQQTNNSNDPLLVDTLAHGCADPSQTNSVFRWNSSNGTTDSAGIGTDTICMNDHYYKIAGTSLQRFDCSAGFRNCTATPEKNITAQKRARVNGFPGLEFRNGTTLALIKKSDTPIRASTSATIDPVAAETSQRRLPGQHECGDSTLRVSQFRWTENNGRSSWPDGVAGRFVCLNDAYYEIRGSTLKHHQCDSNFQNCRENRRQDLIAIGDTKDENGYPTLIFANGDKLSLISR